MKIPLEEFSIKKCLPIHLDEILEIQNKALSRLPAMDILRKNTVQMLSDCLNPPHITLGAWHDNILTAFSVLYFPEDSEENLARQLVSIDTFGLKTANNKLCIVREDFRGNSLQYNLGLILERYAVEANVKMLCSTVSPKNPYSIRNLTLLGFIYNRTLTKYGVERNLYYKFI